MRSSLIFVTLCLVIGLCSAGYFKPKHQITEQIPDKFQFNKGVFVEIDCDHYYDVTIRSSVGNLYITILDQDDDAFYLVFSKDNPVVFIDAYQNYIIVKEVSKKQGKILRYHVIQITYSCQQYKKYDLDSFWVSSQVDDQYFTFNVGQNYRITQILEYDQQKQLLYVIDESSLQLTLYAINLVPRINVLLAVGWFTFHGETIIGGNSRVLFDSSHDQFLIDTKNCRPASSGVQTVYKRVSVCDLTKYQIYRGLSRTVNLIGWYFQFVSESSNKKSLTAFLYSGYGDQAVQGQVHLESNNPLKYFYDQYNYFIAISHCDIYLVHVEWNYDKKKYDVFTGTLSKTVSKSADREVALKDWSSALDLIVIGSRFYFLSSDRFDVYGSNPNYFTKLYQVSTSYAINSDTYVRELNLIEAKKYNER